MRTCTVDGCTEKHSARGFCRRHYQCWRKRGDPALVGSRHRPGAVCDVAGCLERHSAGGFCAKHYMRWWKHGDPMVVRAGGPEPMNQITRLLDKVEIDENGCWIWRGPKNKKTGYGQTSKGSLTTGDARTVLAHRRAYELLVGPIADGLVIDHVYDRGCRSRACVNPDHLEPVTPAENSRRMVEARRRSV